MTSVRARGLGAEIRELRKAAGLRLEHLAQRCGWSRATLGRIESGERVPSEAELTALLDTLAVSGSERVRLFELVHAATEARWWEAGYAGMPSALTALIDFERLATRITDMALALVPGLLQTPDYTRAVLSAGGVRDADLESRVALRLGRQGVLTREEPAQLHAYLDESVVHRPVGGHRVMADQLRHLVRMGRRPNVSVRVIPFSAGAYAELNGSQLILEFARQRPVVHLEQRRRGAFLEVPADTAPFLETAARLPSVALDQAESALLITDVAAAMERECERDGALA
ncbi:helix-turn-helix transcriptional regulator [Saccharopolyspora gloriosae]|uniref:helix-turn-helix domain-containing protein n=1 Tax=Saccharopolyspora gloriosae TaxID=455344 RepID=UPI001FB57D10|nr:helix-turn-helix transcriptional regulator [Saccharopolyspora gloriosae]